MVEIDFYNSFPSCDFFSDEDSENTSRLFKKGDQSTKVDRILAQISMIFNRQGDEGGLYIFLGQKKVR